MINEYYITSDEKEIADLILEKFNIRVSFLIYESAASGFVMSILFFNDSDRDMFLKKSKFKSLCDNSNITVCDKVIVLLGSRVIELSRILVS